MTKIQHNLFKNHLSVRWLPGIGISVFWLGAFCGTGSVTGAQVFNLADYDPIDQVGLELHYDMRDSDGNTVGTLSQAVVEEDGDGYFLTEIISHIEEVTGSARFWQRFDDTGAMVIRSLEFQTSFQDVVMESTTQQFDPPTENFSSLALGEQGTVRADFTLTFTSPFGLPMERSGTLETTIVIEAEEEVTVPAGTFDTIRVHYQTSQMFDDDPANPIEEEELQWYAAGIGAVRRVFQDRDESEPHHMDVLTSYSLPGDPGDPAEPADGFSDWITGYGVPVGQDGPEADPAGDGVPNALKFALGLDPMESAQGDLPVADINSEGREHYLKMEIPLNPKAANFDLVVEFASAPGEWDADAGVVLEQTDELLRVRDSVPLSSAQHRFARLRVDLPENP